MRGYRVKGLAPTGTAAASLREKGISSDTLQRHLTQALSGKPNAQRTFYVVDETSLASTKNIHAFFRTLQPEDHVLLIGDDTSDPKKVGQHTSVEAGRVFQLLQEAGMKTAQFKYQLPILVARDVTLANTKRASSYQIGDVIQYRKGNREVGVKAKEYATVLDRNTDANQITVKTAEGEIATYNPARASGHPS